MPLLVYEKLELKKSKSDTFSPVLVTTQALQWRRDAQVGDKSQKTAVKGPGHVQPGQDLWHNIMLALSLSVVVSSLGAPSLFMC